MDIHQLIAAIVPDVFCDAKARREAKDILSEAAKQKEFCRFLEDAALGWLALPRTMPMEHWTFYGKTVERLVAVGELPRQVQEDFEAAMAGKRHLTSHPEIMRGFQLGLQATQARLWRRLAGKKNALISNQVALRDLYKRAGGPESLLIKMCHGDMREWLNKNLPSTPKGWLIPV